jgi:hypothetical protein
MNDKYNDTHYTRVEPWFGSWPPELKGNGEGIDMKKHSLFHQDVFIPIIGILLGIIMIITPLKWEEQIGKWIYIPAELGIALIVAGILGLTIDYFLRRDLAQNAFNASMGYLLPDELKGELRWIYETNTICVEHTLICELKPIDEDTCCSHVQGIRKFKNISNNSADFKPSIAVDEWFHKNGNSKIISFGYIKNGKGKSDIEPQKTPYTICIPEQNLTLASKEEITVWFEIEEIKRTNDAHIWVFGVPTLNPTMIVKAYEGIGIDTVFGYRNKSEKMGDNVYKLKGTLLAGQKIEIRWWKLSDSQNWTNN